MRERAKFLQKMKEILLAKRDELGVHIDQITKGKEIEGAVRDSADEVSSTLMNRLESSLQAGEINEMKQVEDALARIERGEYGICLDCGEPIGTKRLEIYPYAPRCITCQEKVES